MNYEENLMFFKHLNSNSKQMMQLIQAINDHCDKFYNIIKKSTRFLILFNFNDDKKNEIINKEKKKIKLEIKIKTKTKLRDEKKTKKNNVDENDDDDEKNDVNDDEKNDDDDDEQKKQEK